MASDDKFKGLHLVRDRADLSDPLEVLELLRNAILRKSVDKEEVAKALRQVLNKWEQQNRVFLIAAANAELPRIVRLLNFINSAEDELFCPDRVKKSTTRELTKMYALAQTNLMTGLDSVKRVADMRLDALKAAGGADGAERIFDIEKEEDLNALAGLPSLDATSRDRVRKLMTGLIDAIDKDDSVQEDDDAPKDHTDD